MIEIERKFLIDLEAFLAFAKAEKLTPSTIIQGYLNSHPERCVRVRLRDSSAFITAKGASSDDGLSRYEWEKEISTSEAEELLALCEPTPIHKSRFEVPYHGHLWEIDLFHNDNDGLAIAEIELNDPAESFKKPVWIQNEVTGNTMYYNAYIATHPYCSWHV